MTNNVKTCAAIYKRLEAKKRQVMVRAEEAAKLTIPAIFPPEHQNEQTPLHIPNQSFGAKGCNNLTSKMMLALYPPNTAFFRLDADITAEDVGSEEEAERIRSALAEVETMVVGHLETTKLRPVASNKLLLSVITGNALLDVTDKGDFRVFSVRSYVVERDAQGNVVELVLKEHLSSEMFDEELLTKHFNAAELKEFSDNPEKELTIYTRQHLVDKKYKVYQELNGKVIEDSEGEYPMNAPRFIPVRWRAIDGEDYGRGLVEEYIGDLMVYDGLCLDISLASKQAAKVIFTVPANSVLTAEDIAAAESGDVLEGDADTVKTIQVQKNADFNIPYQRLSKIEQALADAFLMHSSVQRDAERVTAEEIRYMAQELEDALGGVYTIYGQEVQRPLLKRLLNVLSKMRKIPAVPKGVDLKITTGLDALGRSHETNKLITLIRSAQELLGADAVAQRIKSDQIFTELGKGLGVDVDRFLRSDEEVKQMQQEQMAQNITEGAAPNAINTAVQQMMAQQNQQQ